MATLRILLADDHNVVRAGLKALIDAQPDMAVVGEASDGAEVLALAHSYRPDVVVMDLSMPKLNGVEATQQLRELRPEVAVLVLSVHEDATYLRRVLAVGATGYVLKQSAAESLITAIRQVAAGAVYLDPALGDLLMHTIGGNGKDRAAGEPSALSDREAVVLRLIAQGYSNKEIAARLDLSVKTVETYKARAMEKLGLGSRVEIVRYAATLGWLNQLT
jgi:DNA-binding NarL/FixJ family response regulator